MNATVHRPQAIELRLDPQPYRGFASAQRLSLRATGDGWSLLAPDGSLVFRGFGVAGRRQCLEFAVDRGVLAVLG
jgi:hypothetical protein